MVRPGRAQGALKHPGRLSLPPAGLPAARQSEQADGLMVGTTDVHKPFLVATTRVNSSATANIYPPALLVGRGDASQ